MSFTGVIIIWSGNLASIPTGWALCDGTSPTPDLRTYFVYGAASDLEMLDSGGSATHTHTSPSTNSGGAAHTHTFSGTTGGPSATSTILTGALTRGSSAHTHSYSGTTGSGGAAHTHTVSNTGSTNSLPPYIRLYYIMKTSDAVYDIASGTIAMFYGDAADIPSGWSMTLNDKFVYGASSDGEVGNTTTATSHTHTQPTTGASSHTHSKSGLSTGGPTTTGDAGIGATGVASSSHTHTYSFTTGSGGSHSHSMGSTNSGSLLPPYKKLYYILKS